MDQYQQPYPQQPPLCRIEVRTSYPEIMFFYGLVSTIVEINGHKQNYPWGTQYFDVPPGEYEVAVSYQWLFGGWGRNAVRFRIGPQETRRVEYTASYIRFLPGSIKVS